MKICKKCGLEKPLESFRIIVTKGKEYRRLDCIQCNSQQQKASQRKNPNTKKTQLKCHLMRMYGITLETYQELYTAQEGKCAICLSPQDRLYVDHCHNSKKIRGLLCHSCNVGLGHFRDNPTLLKTAIAYLTDA